MGNCMKIIKTSHDTKVIEELNIESKDTSDPGEVDKFNNNIIHNKQINLYMEQLDIVNNNFDYAKLKQNPELAKVLLDHFERYNLKTIGDYYDKNNHLIPDEEKNNFRSYRLLQENAYDFLLRMRRRFNL